MKSPLETLRDQVARADAGDTWDACSSATRMARAVADEGTVEKLIEPLNETYQGYGQNGALRSAGLDPDHYAALIRTILSALASMGVG